MFSHSLDKQDYSFVKCFYLNTFFLFSGIRFKCRWESVFWWGVDCSYTWKMCIKKFKIEINYNDMRSSGLNDIYIISNLFSWLQFLLCQVTDFCSFYYCWFWLLFWANLCNMCNIFMLPLAMRNWMFWQNSFLWITL